MLLTDFVAVGRTLVTGTSLRPKISDVKRLSVRPRLVDSLCNELVQPTQLSPLINTSSALPITNGHGETTQVQDERNGLFASLLGSPTDLRQQQIKAISQHRTEDKRSAVEEKADRKLAISSVALALTAGGVVFPPLNLLGVPALLLTIQPLVTSAYRSIRYDKKIGVGVLDSLGTVSPLLMHYYFIAALASWLSNVSRKLLLKTEDQSRASLINVFGEQPASVWIEKDGVEVEIPFEQLAVGDRVVVSAGQSIPVDGEITQGVASIDERALTGESQPVEKGIGDPVFASTLLLAGQILVRVEKAGTETVAAQIGQILNHTADYKSGIQSQGQRVVEQGAIPTILLSALTLPILGAESALAALYSAFGYHMRFAAPVSVLNFLRITSENGILIKDGRSLELLAKVDTFVFDKTGTLTAEVPTVGQIFPCGTYREDDLLSYAAAAEGKQTHPIAQAIRHAAQERGLLLPTVNDAKVEVGYGLTVRLKKSALVKDDLIHVGSSRFMTMAGIALPGPIRLIEESSHNEGYSLVYVAINQQLAGVIELRPTIRPEAQGIIAELRKKNLGLYIISGDHEKPTQKLAAELGIDHYFAEVLPQNKASLIEQLQREGRAVCFVGDGINDSIALKTANVSVSLRGASTVATDAASIVLMDNSLKKLTTLWEIAQELDSNLKRSIAFTILPGAICIGGVYFAHFGLASAVALYNIGLAVSVANALWPLLKHERTKVKALVQDLPLPVDSKQQHPERDASAEIRADFMKLPSVALSSLPKLNSPLAEPA